MFQEWRIVNKASFIWIHWLYSYWLCRKPFWTSPIPSKCSWSLKKIYEAMCHIRYSPGTYSNFLLWHDPWVNNRPIVNQLGSSIISIMESNNSAILEDLLSTGSWENTSSNHVIAIEFRHICATARCQAQDNITWDSSSKNQTNISSIWNSLRSTSIAPHWISLVWHKFSVPKFSILAWLVMKKRLLTLDRMMRFGMTTSTTCILCLTEGETHEHLFCECSFIRDILNSWHLQFSYLWHHFVDGNFLIHRTDNIRMHMSHLFLAAAFHATWTERNKRRHITGHQRTASQLACEIKRIVREKMSTYTVFQSRDTSLLLLLY